jgi:hypothetical protein
MALAIRIPVAVFRRFVVGAVQDALETGRGERLIHTEETKHFPHGAGTITSQICHRS